MTTYVLVHGAASGAWVWHRVMPHLKQQGHRVIAPDLPGHGLNPRPMAEITLAAYVDCVGEILAAQTEPVILVGHSLGGAVITQVAEQYPDRIHTLVYLAGYLLRSGETMLEITQADDESLLLANAVFLRISSRPPFGLKPYRPWAMPTAMRLRWNWCDRCSAPRRLLPWQPPSPPPPNDLGDCRACILPACKTE